MNYVVSLVRCKRSGDESSGQRKPEEASQPIKSSFAAANTSAGFRPRIEWACSRVNSWKNIFVAWRMISPRSVVVVVADR